MIWLVLPIGITSGWSNCGRYLANELSAIDELRIVGPRKEALQFENPMEAARLSKLFATQEEKEAFQASHDDVVIQAVDELSQIWGPHSGGKNNIGISFNLYIEPSQVRTLKNYFRHIAAGSTWCAKLFQEREVPATAVPQGVDREKFNRDSGIKTRRKDEFVIFSGGKFELRKGQDYVIRAFAHLQQKYSDVHLVTMWDGVGFAFNSMAYSPHIVFPEIAVSPQVDRMGVLTRLLIDNKISLSQVTQYPMSNHSLLAQIYQNSDIGLFPGRIEGGTNLVLMEYMACGKPVIAPCHTGYFDMVQKDHALILEQHERKDKATSQVLNMDFWYELSLDEIIAKLEWAYENRGLLPAMGENAAKYISPFTWKRMAETLLRL